MAQIHQPDLDLRVAALAVGAGELLDLRQELLRAAAGRELGGRLREDSAGAALS